MKFYMIETTDLCTLCQKETNTCLIQLTEEAISNYPQFKKCSCGKNMQKVSLDIPTFSQYRSKKNILELTLKQIEKDVYFYRKKLQEDLHPLQIDYCQEELDLYLLEVKMLKEAIESIPVFPDPIN